VHLDGFDWQHSTQEAECKENLADLAPKCSLLAAQSIAGRMLARQMSKQNPQAIGALGGFRLKLRPLPRIGVSGDTGVYARAIWS
jgi:hypothetical protein